MNADTFAPTIHNFCLAWLAAHITLNAGEMANINCALLIYVNWNNCKVIFKFAPVRLTVNMVPMP